MVCGDELSTSLSSEADRAPHRPSSVLYVLTRLDIAYPDWDARSCKARIEIDGNSFSRQTQPKLGSARELLGDMI